MISSFGVVSASPETVLHVYLNGYLVYQANMDSTDLNMPFTVELCRYPENTTQWYRWIRLDMYNSENKLVFSDKKLTYLPSRTFYIQSSQVKPGNYTLFFHYDGNSKDNMLPSSCIVKLHVE